MALGFDPKDLPKYASFPSPSDDWRAGGVYKFQPFRPAAEGTTLQSPFVLDPMSVPAPTTSTTSPASTAIAINLQNRQSADSRTDRARGKAQIPGQSQAPSPDATGAVSPGGMPYFTRPTSQSGIERIDVQGQAPLFTNMGGAGLDDLAKKGATLPSVPGFLRGVPSFGAGVNAGQIGYGGGGGGLIPPSVYSRLDELERQAEPLLKSSGIVDRLRGRQLLRQRERYANTAAALANVEVGGAHGAAALGAVGVAQQRANQEAAQNFAANTLRLREISAQERGQDLGFLPHLATTVQGQLAQQATQKGDIEGFERIMQAGRFAPQEKNPTIQILPDGRIVYARGTERPEIFTADELDRNKRLAKAGLISAASGR